MIPESAPQLLITFLFVVPGFVFQGARIARRGRLPGDIDLSTRIMRAIATSGVFGLVYLLVLGPLLVQAVRGITEALNADVDDLVYDRGHRALRITRKGGKVGRVAIAPVTSRALDAYVVDRTTGPIFLNRDNTARLSYSSAYEQFRRLARAADMPGAEAVHPHSFRHTFATEALAAGAALQDVQDVLGHADPRTTRRYDRSRNRLDKDPTYALAAAMGRI